MNNMNKFGTVKDFFELMNFDISTDETTHPVVSYDDRGEYLQLAKDFQRYQC